MEKEKVKKLKFKYIGPISYIVMDNKQKINSVLEELWCMWVIDKGIIIRFNNLINSVFNFIKNTNHDDDEYLILHEICTELNWIDKNRTKDNSPRKPLIKKLYQKFQKYKL